MKILIIDDEPQIIEILEMELSDLGHIVVSANSIQEAKEKLHANAAVDLILSDMKMPDADGLEILNYLKSKNLQIPVIFISGSLQIDINDLKAKGAKGFIMKPIDIDDLLGIMNSI